MNIRQAILKTADLFESQPHLFNFQRIRFPDCGTPGCAIGYVGYFLGITDSTVHPVCQQILGVDSDVFYDRMSISAMQRGGVWTRDANECVARLRIYADKYHPAEPAPIEINKTIELPIETAIQPASIPDSVRNIFIMTPEALYQELAK